MKNLNDNAKDIKIPEIKEEFLHPAASYLRIPDDETFSVLGQGNTHSFCKMVPGDSGEQKIWRKPSMLKRIYHTFF
ncbi:MAG: hypothetical protein PHT96_14590 [Syntrophorhabdaceae bacterium]|nr:hypothetical protein [Syntrophorhabdaceae bacterium]